MCGENESNCPVKVDQATEGVTVTYLLVGLGPARFARSNTCSFVFRNARQLNGKVSDNCVLAQARFHTPNNRLAPVNFL
jgi:hypothetical protein